MPRCGGSCRSRRSRSRSRSRPTGGARCTGARLPEPAIEPKPLTVELLPEFTIAGGVEARRETVDRTLFNPTRRPAPASVVEAQKPRMQRGQFALTGTLVIDGKSTAFLREVNGGKSRRVQQGETINGLTVAEVKPDRDPAHAGRRERGAGAEGRDQSAPDAPGPRAPAAGGPGAAGAGQAARPASTAAPSVPAPQDVGATLAERRRAARAAAAAQAGDATAPAAVPAPAPVPAAASVPTSTIPPTKPGAAAATPADPAWGEVYQRMQQQPRR